MTRDLTVDELWDSAASGERTFRAADISRLPEAARRYIEYAIAPGTQLARAIRLGMHGQIKLQHSL